MRNEGDCCRHAEHKRAMASFHANNNVTTFHPSWHTRKTSASSSTSSDSHSSPLNAKPVSVQVHVISASSPRATHTISTNPRCTVLAIKAELYALTKVPPSQQILTRGFDGNKGKEGWTALRASALSDTAAVLPPGHDAKVATVFTMRVAPLDVDLLMRRARRFRKYITYEAFKAEDEQRVARQRKVRAHAKLQKAEKDEKKRQINDRAFDEWLSRVNKEKCLRGKQKTLPTGSLVRLREASQVTLEKESRHAKLMLKDIMKDLEKIGVGDASKCSELEKKKTELMATRNRRFRTVNSSEIFTVVDVEVDPPSSTSNTGSRPQTALQVDNSSIISKQLKKLSYCRLESTDGWQLTVPTQKVVTAISDEDDLVEDGYALF